MIMDITMKMIIALSWWEFVIKPLAELLRTKVLAWIEEGDRKRIK